MRTAQECLLRAFTLERAAGECKDRFVGLMMLETAKHWRILAKVAAPRSERSSDDIIDQPAAPVGPAKAS